MVLETTETKRASQVKQNGHYKSDGDRNNFMNTRRTNKQKTYTHVP